MGRTVHFSGIFQKGVWWIWFQKFLIHNFWQWLNSVLDNVYSHYTEKIMSRMLKLCKAVIHAKGGHIDERKFSVQLHLLC